MLDWKKNFYNFRQQQRQGKATRWLGSGIVLLTTLLMSQHLADGNSPTFHFHPLSPPNALAPTSESSAETDPDPRATELAARLRQRMTGFQAAAQQTATQLTPRQSMVLSQLRARVQDAVSVRLRPNVGTPRQIKGKVLEHAQSSFFSGRETHTVTARTFLQANRGLLRLDDPQAELKLTRQQTDELDRTHLRFDQTYKGLSVWPAELIVHLDPSGHVDLLNGAFVPTPKKLDIVPALDKATAIEYARTGLTDGDKAEVAASELIIYAPGDTLPRLAWKLELHISLTSHWLVVIDAINGDELTAYNQVMHQHVSGSGVDLFGTRRPLNVWQESGRFWMIDTSKPMFDLSPDPEERGAIWIYDARNQPPTSDPEHIAHNIPPAQVANSRSSTAGWLPDAVSASYHFSEVYDYYRERHNRDSFDDEGASIHAIVRLGRNFRNAFWNPGLNLMAFGDGLPYAGALDVTGHELTHGVITHSANLDYQNQPGALNEAFADIFGEMIEARTTGEEPDWLNGGVLGRALRNLANPSSLEFAPGCFYPQRMGDFFEPNDPCLAYLADRDNGGIHINSSIINRAYYLLAAGLAGAIGLRDAERIFYRALTVHLTRNSQFIDARLACIQAAEELFGTGSSQARKTAEAFDAVEIGAAPPTPDPPDIPSVQGPDATLFVYRDQFGYFRLGRRENDRGDEAQGTRLANAVVAAARPSVSRNGDFAVFVNAQNDLCFIGIDGSGEECLGFPGLIHSVAMSPDGQLFGFVLLNARGNRDNRISILDLETGEDRTFTLTAASYDGPATDTILHADAMDFTNDGQWVIYDALNAITFADGPHLRQWSLYALHLATGTSLTLTTPTPGLDVGFPALSQTSDNFLTFDAFDEARNESTVYAANLNTGEYAPIATVAGDFGVPGYTGDDTAIIFTQRDPAAPSGFSLFRQPLAADRITPQGQASVWLRNADFGVIYRRPSTPPPPGFLGNPAPASFQSGIGVISGWVCEAEEVEIEFRNGTTNTVETYEAGYGTIREDTEPECGDSDNGFGLLWNWNRLGDGEHVVRALVDGVELGQATVTVTTLGEEFARGLSGQYRLANFPSGGDAVHLHWNQAQQNFVLGPAVLPEGDGTDRLGDIQVGFLGNPSPASPQSGIGVISGWVCEAEEVEIELTNGSTGAVQTYVAAYGTSRTDTASICGDSDNGFGLLWNWNRLGDGEHVVRALVDGGEELGGATVVVTTLGEEFARGLSGQYRLEDFPTVGQAVTVEWQEAQQNFVITGVQ